MDILIQGHRRFHAEVFPLKRKLYHTLADGQSPRYLFITCCDSRVQPTEFTNTEPGDMFMERSVGNIIPLPETSQLETSASIEYAVRALKVQHIVVCGHSNCGAMKALLKPESLADLPAVSAWVANAGITRESILQKYPNASEAEHLDLTIRENVITQLEHLKQHDCVKQALQDGLLEVHGWVFEIEHGRIVEYDRSSGAFLPLFEAHSTALA